MMGRTHFVGASVAALGTIIVLPKIFLPLNTIELFSFIGSAALGGFFLDVDSKSSGAYTFTKIILTIYKIILFPIYLPLKIVLKFCYKKSPFLQKHISTLKSYSYHRGIFHSIIPYAFIFLLYLIKTLIQYKPDTPFVKQGLILLFIGFFVGTLSHIFLDMLSGGVMLLLPLSNKKFTLSHIKTGGRTDYNFYCIFCCLLILFGIVAITILKGYN